MLVNSTHQCEVSSLLCQVSPMSLDFFSNSRTISPISSLVGKGENLIDDATFSVGEITSSCSSRRRRLHNKFESRYTCTISEEETLWTSVLVSSRPSVPGPPGSSEKFVQPSPFLTRSTKVASPVKHKGSSPKLSTATLSVPRVSADVPFRPETTPNQAKSS